MSAVTRPRGPLPSRVYWFRRVLVLVVLLAVVVGVVRLWRATAGGDSAADAAGAADVARVVAGDPTASPSAGVQEPSATAAEAGADPSTSPAGRRTRLAEPSGPCQPSDLLVVPSAPRAHAGSEVRIRLEISSLETEACTFEVSADSVVAAVSSEEIGEIWSTQQCPSAVPATTVVPRRTKPAKAVVLWDGRESTDGCSALSSWVLSGSYTLGAVAVGSDAPVEVAFELAGPVAPTVTVTPTPTERARRDGTGSEGTREDADGSAADGSDDEAGDGAATGRSEDGADPGEGAPSGAVEPTP